MPTLPDLTQRLLDWLRAQPTDPPVREYTLCAALPEQARPAAGATGLPPSAYPQLAVLPTRVRFVNRQCAAAEITLRLACCAGRPVDALAQAQSLATQLQARVEGSQGLGGLARSVEVGEIRLKAQGVRHRAVAETPLVQLVELEVALKFNT